MIAITVDTYEVDPNEPSREVLTLRHVYFGDTFKRAMEVERAHRTTDEFYRGAVTKGKWRQIRLMNVAWVEEGTQVATEAIRDSLETLGINLETGEVF